ncbi:MAG TPA: double zinc ribbon domain-containing protein, partial [Geobacteraceae bacterium]|nr:double zinc ribbon domain-containing protein [Geobacteraceae bacterium]
MLKALLDVVFPPRCHACKTFIPGAGDLHICATCLDACTLIGSPLCKICGIPFRTEGGDDHLCGGCITAP